MTKKTKPAYERYVELFKKMEREKGKPASERKRPLDEYRKELDDMYMGELTVYDREKVRARLKLREL